MDISSLSGLGGLNSTGLDSLNAYKKEKIESSSFEDALQKAQENGDDKELKKACVQFESYFIKMMLSNMRSTVDTSGGFIEQSNAEKIFTDMLDEEYANKAAEGGNGIGLAQAMYKQLSKNVIKQ